MGLNELIEKSYGYWLMELDEVFFKELGIDHNSFEDYNWRDAFNDGLEPPEAFEMWTEEMVI